MIRSPVRATNIIKIELFETKCDKMNTAVITDKRQDNNMIRDCYNGYRCIISQNIVSSASVHPRLCTLNVARATEDSTQLDHRHFTENKTKNIFIPFCNWVPEMDDRVMWAQHGCKVTPGFAVTLGELSDLITLFSVKSLVPPFSLTAIELALKTQLTQ